MLVRKMMELLEKRNPNAEIKMHGREGNNALFVAGYVGDEDIVVIEDKSDVDLRAELYARFERVENGEITELEYFTDLVETGITLEDIQVNMPEKYEYSKLFMEEHGLCK